MTTSWQSDCGRATLFNGDCTEILRTLPDASVDCCITDPPYPCIKRDYGVWTEAEWHAMMDVVVPEVRRILKPTGSAVFILQPNSERVGRMRPWLWEFMAKWTREWGMVQDAWWWNPEALPLAGTRASQGLMRSSVKCCVWMGLSGCYRDQGTVLWSEAHSSVAQRAAKRVNRGRAPRVSIGGLNDYTARHTAVDRGGVTPFNLLPFGPDGKVDQLEHGARTPERLCDWWLRYICPPGGTVLDPFIGSGTVGLAAVKRGCGVIGAEKMPKYYRTSQERLEAELAKDRQLELIA